MPFVELFVPKGAIQEAQREHIAAHLVRELMVAEGAPDTEAAREISWLLVQEVDAWSVGGRRVGPSEPARYVARVAVPAGSLDDAKRADMVERVSRVLAEAEEKAGGDGDGLTRRPDAWVHITEIPDGNWGALGQVVRLADIAGFVTGSPMVSQ